MVKKILNILLSLGVAIPALADGDSCSLTDIYIQEASKIRGLKVKKSVPCYSWTREQTKDYLIKNFLEDMPSGRIEDEGFVYKALGIIPDDFNYEREAINLISSQIAGFYDQKKKFFVMLKEAEGGTSPIVVVHELTHALQDQYFNLKKLIDNKNYASDELLAHSALAEGDATAVMMDSQFYGYGYGVNQMSNVSSMIMQNIIGSYFNYGLRNAPSALVSMMLFPYNSGLRFVHHFLEGKDYREIDKIFRNPPRSTEEILHFEKYGTPEPDFIQFTREDVYQAFQKQGEKDGFSDVIGEFAISALLKANGRMDCVEASEGWGGDLVLIVPEDGKKSVLWLTAWDSKKDADEFFAAYTGALENRYQKKIEGRSAQLTQNKSVQIKQDDKRVLVQYQIKN